MRFSAQAANIRRNLDVPRAERSGKQRPYYYGPLAVPSIAFDAMETPLGVAGARARNSVGSSDWQALCDLEAELEAELRDEVTRSSERSRRKRAEGNGTSWDSPGVSSGPPTRARASTERPASSRSSPTASSSPGYRLRRQPHPSWAPSASQTPASASSPGADRSPRRSRWSIELGVVLDGFGRPMLPLDTSASFARPGRAPLRERETKTWAETTPAVASAVPAARRERLDRLDAGENGDKKNGDDVGGPVVDVRAGAHRVRGGFVDDARRISAARPVRPRALAGSVFQERRERLKRLSRDTSRAARPPFVVGAGDSARARFLKASAFGPRKENRSSSSIGGKSVFARSFDFPDATPRKASHTHASSAGIAGRAAGEGAFSVAPDPGNRASPRREDPPPRAEGGANGDVFAAAVDATRSLFDAVERRVRDAVAREMETRHRLGGAQAVASPGSEPSPVPRPTAPSAASPPSSLEPAKDARGSAASADDVSEALASASPLSGLSRDGKTPIRAVKRSIDAYLERRRSGSAAAASTRSSPVVPRRSDDAPPRRTEPSFATMTAKQRALEPPKLVIRDVTDSNRDGFESETFLESDPEPFTYAPVYSPAAARDATASLHSSFKTSSSISSAARTEESPQPSKRRFARGVDSIGVDLRARLRAAARVVSPRERDADDARTSPTRFSKNSDSDASDDGDAFTGDAFFKHTRLNVPETSSDSDVSRDSDSKEDVHVARGGDGLELVSFCRRYRAARVCAVVLERWMYQARLRAALAAAHHAHVSRARAFYAWRAERLERAIRAEVALRFATHARKTRARRLLAKTTRAWLRETRRAKAFRVAEVAPTASSESHGDGLAAARARLRPVGLVPRLDSTAAEDVVRDARDARAMAEMGTMTDDVDDEVFDVETVPVSLDAFTRVLVDGLVDETVRAHEAAEACGPLVSSIPTALATNLFEDAAPGICGVDFHGGERDGSDEDGIERRRPTVASEPRGFSPENAAAVDSVTADAADAVGVAVRGLLGLWKLSDETHVDANGESSSPSSLRATARRRSAAKSKSKSPRVTNAFATPKRALRFDPLRDGAASDENDDDDEFAGSTTRFDSTGIRSRNTSRNTPRSSSSLSRPRRSRRVVFDRALGTTMLSAGKVRGAEGENVYLSIAEYVDVVNKAAASYV